MILPLCLFSGFMPFVPTQPVPFSQMRLQPRRMHSGRTCSTHALPSAAYTVLDRDKITAAHHKRQRKNARRLTEIERNPQCPSR